MVVVFLVEEEGGLQWSSTPGRVGTNVKPRHVHTYALRPVKKEVQKLTTTRSM
jgi:hypothetical protein